MASNYILFLNFHFKQDFVKLENNNSNGPQFYQPRTHTIVKF